jgi:putative molybdopterin biosynthesis protein
MIEDAMTVEEVARLLRVSRATVYNLRSKGELLGYTVGRKLRFSREDVITYIARQRSENDVSLQESGAEPARGRADLEQPFRVSGRDVALDMLTNYLVQMDIRLQRSYLTSYEGLIALYHGRVQVATAHLWDGESEAYNLSYARCLVPGTPTVLVRIFSRMQGFLVAQANPRTLRRWEDLLQPGIRIVNHEKGSAERVLLDERLRLVGAVPSRIDGYQTEAASPILLVGRVARGHADCMVGTQRLTNMVEGVDFVPLQKENLDMVVRQEDYDTLPVRALVNVLQSGILRGSLKGFADYDTSEMGHVIRLE